MALCVAQASLALSSDPAAKFFTACGETRSRISNGAGNSGFGGELVASEQAQCSAVWTTMTRRREELACAAGRSRSDSWGSKNLLRRQSAKNGGGTRLSKSMQGMVAVRASVKNEFDPREVVESKGLTYDGPGRGGQWLSSTTRHVRIYIGVADPKTKMMDQTQLDKITLMLDPDNEFLWPEDKPQKVYDYFAELVEGYAGAPMTEYTIRLIGSDVEHYIRKLLLANEIKYNLDCRVLNFSMGKPRYASGIIEKAEE